MAVNVVAAANRIFQEFNTTMLKAFDESPRVWPAYAMEVPSSSRSSMYAWLADQATVREWSGSRVANEMGTRTWEVINRQFELTYKFKVNQINDDLSGLVGAAVMRARSDGRKWARHEDLLMATVLEAGTSALCYDGQYFFDTDHPVDLDGISSTSTYSNSLSGVLTHANYNAALVQMHSYKLEDGSPMVPPGTKLSLIVPPALALTAKQIVSIETLTAAAAYGLYGTGGMSTNPFVGTATIVENAYLTSTTRWYLTADDAGIKPLMFQRRQALETNEQGVGTQLYFDKKEISIGGDARYEGSYTLPQLALTSA